MSDNRKKFILVDNVIIGANHVIGNAGYVNFIQSLYPGESDVTFYGEPSHIENIKTKILDIPGNTISYKYLNIVRPQSGLINKNLSWYKKIKQDKKDVIAILDQARKDKVEMVLFCILTHINLYLFNPIFKKYPDLKIAVVLHGEMEYLFNSHNTKMQDFKALLYKKSFAKSPSNIKYFVVSELIYSKLIHANIFTKDRLSYIEHPINEISRNEFVITNEGKITFAQIGIGSLRKGTQHIFTLAEKNKNAIKIGQANFEIIGKLYPDIIHLQNEFVDVLAKDNLNISQEKYEASIMNATYALCFITGEDYVFRVSGSVIDTIQYQLPIIALEHEFVNHLFEKGGDIGFLCKDIEDMNNVVDKIINRDPAYVSRYSQQIKNLKTLATQYYNNNITELFRKNIKTLGW